MLNIYLCEVQVEQLDYYKKTIQNYLFINELKPDFTLYTTDPHELLESLAKTKSTGLYFLDIELDADIDGIELARKIRTIDSRGFIIFITTHKEKSFLTFQYNIEAMDYILKDDLNNLRSHICKCIKLAYERYLQNQADADKLLTLKTGNTISYFQTNTILYLISATTSHKIEIHTIEGVKEIYGTLNELGQQLSQSFYRCHKNCIINTIHIQTVDIKTNVILLDNGETCYASIKARRNLLKKLFP